LVRNVLRLSPFNLWMGPNSMPAGRSIYPTSDMPVSKPNPIPPSSPAQAPVAEPSTVELLGIELALTDYERTLDWIDAMVESRRRAYVIPAAVHCMMVAHEEPETWDAVQGGLVVPDGQPLVWAMRMLGHPTASRVYGPELMARYCERAASTGTRMFLYGGRNQGALVQLALNLRRRYPGVKIVGGYSPPFRELDDEEFAAVTDEINRSGADVVWVGIGQPKQEKWMAAMRGRLDAPVLIGVGAAFDFHAGLVPQAPSWMQELGLEWAYRLAHEPRRLWRRYARYNPRFVAAFARQWAQHQRRR
jgi:N-acetylglucosaminyldiphosphoundecaprenol N-acetyl-beta-D-mannosaminyltransferase